MKLFTAGLMTETNVFSPFPTGAGSWAIISPSATAAERARAIFGSSFAIYDAVAADAGAALVQGTYAAATPLGITPKAVYERLRDTLLDELRAALPVEGVLLTMHGSMVADGYDDCESDLVGRMRTIAPDAIIGAILDPHCDMPSALVDAADVLICFKEYPHTDVDERARDLALRVIDAVKGVTRPAISTFDCRMIAAYPTQYEPMRSFVQEMKDAEQEPGILSVSLCQGFMYADSPLVGSRMLVVTDGDPARGNAIAERFGRRLFELRDEIVVKPLSVEDALDLALAPHPDGRPVVVADRADNAGGGAPSDSTFALAELLRRGARDVAVAVLWDPVVVALCEEGGEGAVLDLRLGGKMGPMSGLPLDRTRHRPTPPQRPPAGRKRGRRAGRRAGAPSISTSMAST